MSESHVTPTPVHPAAHGHAPAAGQFSEAQMLEFQSEDRHAGGAVVVLMAAIFTIGLLLYIGVFCFVAASPIR